jgi:uncharacterized protein YjdB
LQYAGLFGEAGNCTIKNLTVNLRNSDGGIFATESAGGLVGYLNGDALISNCHVNGIVSSYKVAGGLVGRYFSVDPSRNVRIENCSTSGSLNDVLTMHQAQFQCKAGGLIGEVEVNSNSQMAISGCRSTSVVTTLAKNNSIPINAYAYAGGLIGHCATGNSSKLTVENCYASGAVSATIDKGSGYAAGTSIVGGLIGRASSTTIRNCYATGELSTGAHTLYPYAGGLVGTQNSVAATGCYRLARNMNQPNIIECILGSPLSAVGMLTQSNFTGWDFNTVWATKAGAYTGPALRKLDPAFVQGVTLSQSTLNLDMGQQKPLQAAVAPSTAVNKKVIWSSSNTNIAAIRNGSDTSCQVYGQGVGTAYIYATSEDGGYKASCKVVVTDPTIPVTSITLNKTSMLLKLPASETLTATVAPANATDKTVSWSTSNNAVATVNAGGMVTAVTAGTAEITAMSADRKVTARCTVTVEAIPLTGLTVYPTGYIVYAGSAYRVFPTFIPSNATNKNLTWSSSNSGVVSVDSTGCCTANAPGSAVITARAADGGYTATCTFTVHRRTNSVELGKHDLTLTEGQWEKLTAVVSPADATWQEVEWSVNNSAVAAVSQDGTVTAISEGDAVVYAKVKNTDIEDSCAVAVQPKVPVPVTGVTLNRSGEVMPVGATSALIATILPDEATNKGMAWESSNPGVASVVAGGWLPGGFGGAKSPYNMATVTALSPGTAVITVRTADGGFTAAYTATVAEYETEPTKITLDEALKIDEGSFATLVPILEPAKATLPEKREWSSDDLAVVTVDNDGNVFGVSAGTAVVSLRTTTANGTLGASCKITVYETSKPALVSVTLDEKDVTMSVGGEKKLNATVYPIGKTPIRWASENPGVASVSTSGLITAVSPGETYVSASVNRSIAFCKVTVLGSSVPVTGVALDETTLSLEAGETAKLTASVRPHNAANQFVAWASSGTDVAAVDDWGNVEAGRPGEAVITVTSEDGGFTAQCRVLVSEPYYEQDCGVVSVSGVTASAGGTVYVPIKITDNPGLVAMRLSVEYNEQYLTLQSVTDGGLLGSQYHSNQYKSPYVLFWDDSMRSANNKVNGTIAALNFKVGDDAPDGVYPVKVSYDFSNYDILDCNLNTVYFETQDGFVNIGANIKYGDVNDDGSVNMMDSSILARHLGNWAGIVVNMAASDVNADGRVNPADLSILRRHLAKWAGYEILPCQPQQQQQALFTPLAAETSPLAAPVAAFAADTQDPTIYVSDVRGNIGDVVDVNIGYAGNPGIIAMRLSVQFDSSALRLVGVIDKGILGSQFHSDQLVSPYVLMWENGGSPTNFMTNGDLASLRFEILSDKGSAITPAYDIDNYDLYNFDFEKVYFAVKSGSVSVGEEEKTVLDSITIASPPAKSSYTEGDALDLSGLIVTAKYSDNSTRAVTGYFTDPASGVTLNTVGTQPVTISYTEDGVTKTAGFNVRAPNRFPAAQSVSAICA